MNSGPSTAVANALENRPRSVQIGSLRGFESTQKIGPLPAVVEATREAPCDETVNLRSIDVCPPRQGRERSVEHAGLDRITVLVDGRPAAAMRSGDRDLMSDSLAVQAIFPDASD